MARDWILSRLTCGCFFKEEFDLFSNPVAVSSRSRKYIYIYVYISSPQIFGDETEIRSVSGKCQISLRSIRNRTQLKRFVPAALGQPQIGAPGRGGLTASASKTLCIETRITRFTNQSDDSIHIGNSWGILCNSCKMCVFFFFSHTI